MPGGTRTSGFTATTSSTTDTAATGTTSTSTAPNIKVVAISDAALQVAVANTTTAGLPAATPVDLSKIKDTSPPKLTLQGTAYVEVLQGSTYTDAGATAYDNIDGNNVNVGTKLLMCQQPDGVQAYNGSEQVDLSCSTGLILTVNSSIPTTSGWAYVYNYTARDTAGNQALPVRRYVVVMSR